MLNYTSSLTPVPTPKIAKAERRQWIRYSTPLTVSLRRFGAQENSVWNGQLQDVSATGAGLVSEWAVDVGAILEVRPTNCAWSLEQKLTVRVRKVVKLARGGWRLGCTFVRKLTDEELQGML